MLIDITIQYCILLDETWMYNDSCCLHCWFFHTTIRLKPSIRNHWWHLLKWRILVRLVLFLECKLQEIGKLELWIDLEFYIHKIMKRFNTGMEESNPVRTALDEIQRSTKSMCHNLWAVLMFAAYISGPDVSFVVNMLSQFNHNPMWEKHTGRLTLFLPIFLL